MQFLQKLYFIAFLGLLLRPLSSSAEEYVDVKEIAHEKRVEAIEQLNADFSEDLDKETKADLRLRLGSLYLKEGGYYQSKRQIEQREKALEYYKKSIILFQAILDEYPEYKRKDEVLYYLADVYYLLGKKRSLLEEERRTYLSKAYDNYMEVARITSAERYAEYCAETAIFAADEMITLDKKDGLGTERRVKTDISPIELGLWEQKKLEALIQYTERYPAGRNYSFYLYSTAEMFFSTNHFQQSLTISQAVIDKNPSTQQAEFAAGLIIDMLALLAQDKEKNGDIRGAITDYRALQQKIEEFQKIEALGDETFKQILGDVKERVEAKLQTLQTGEGLKAKPK